MVSLRFRFIEGDPSIRFKEGNPALRFREGNPALRFKEDYLDARFREDKVKVGEVSEKTISYIDSLLDDPTIKDIIKNEENLDQVIINNLLQNRIREIYGNERDLYAGSQFRSEEELKLHLDSVYERQEFLILWHSMTDEQKKRYGLDTVISYDSEKNKYISIPLSESDIHKLNPYQIRELNSKVKTIRKDFENAELNSIIYLSKKEILEKSAKEVTKKIEKIKRIRDAVIEYRNWLNSNLVDKVLTSKERNDLTIIENNIEMYNKLIEEAKISINDPSDRLVRLNTQLGRIIDETVVPSLEIEELKFRFNKNEEDIAYAETRIRNLGIELEDKLGYKVTEEIDVNVIVNDIIKIFDKEINVYKNTISNLGLIGFEEEIIRINEIIKSLNFDKNLLNDIFSKRNKLIEENKKLKNELGLIKPNSQPTFFIAKTFYLNSIKELSKRLSDQIKFAEEEEWFNLKIDPGEFEFDLIEKYNEVKDKVDSFFYDNMYIDLDVEEVKRFYYSIQKEITNIYIDSYNVKRRALESFKKPVVEVREVTLAKLNPVELGQKKKEITDLESNIHTIISIELEDYIGFSLRDDPEIDNVVNEIKRYIEIFANIANKQTGLELDNAKRILSRYNAYYVDIKNIHNRIIKLREEISGVNKKVEFYKLIINSESLKTAREGAYKTYTDERLTYTQKKNEFERLKRLKQTGDLAIALANYPKQIKDKLGLDESVTNDYALTKISELSNEQLNELHTWAHKTYEERTSDWDYYKEKVKLTQEPKRFKAIVFSKIAEMLYNDKDAQVTSIPLGLLNFKDICDEVFRSIEDTNSHITTPEEAAGRDREELNRGLLESKVEDRLDKLGESGVRLTTEEIRMDIVEIDKIIDQAIKLIKDKKEEHKDEYRILIRADVYNYILKDYKDKISSLEERIANRGNRRSNNKENRREINQLKERLETFRLLTPVIPISDKTLIDYYLGEKDPSRARITVIIDDDTPFAEVSSITKRGKSEKIYGTVYNRNNDEFTQRLGKISYSTVILFDGPNTFKVGTSLDNFSLGVDYKSINHFKQISDESTVHTIKNAIRDDIDTLARFRSTSDEDYPGIRNSIVEELYNMKNAELLTWRGAIYKYTRSNFPDRINELHILSTANPEKSYRFPWQSNEPNTLDQESLKTVGVSISPTGTILYSNCQREYFLRFISKKKEIYNNLNPKFAREFGTMIHAIFETGVLRGYTEIGEFMGIAREVVATKNFAENNIQNSDILNRIENAIQYYLANNEPITGLTHIEAEKRVTAIINGVRVSGIIDRVDINGDIITIIDYKTGLEYTVPLHEVKLQLGLYALAAKKMYGYRQANLKIKMVEQRRTDEYIVLEDGTVCIVNLYGELEKVFDLQEVETFYENTISEIKEKLKDSFDIPKDKLEERFTCTNNRERCVACGFKNSCPQGIESPSDTSRPEQPELPPEPPNDNSKYFTPPTPPGPRYEYVYLRNELK